MAIKKKKLSVSIDKRNFEKIDRIIKNYSDQTTSSIINYGLDLSLEEVEDLLKNPLELEQEILKRKMEDLKKMTEIAKKHTLEMKKQNDELEKKIELKSEEAQKDNLNI